MRFAVLQVLLVSALLPFGSGKSKGPAEFDVLAPPDTPPAVAWALPLKGGAIPALAIAPRYALNDAAELARRLDLRLAVAPVWTAHRLYAGDEASPLLYPPSASTAATTAQETLARLEEGLRAGPRVILMGNLDLGMLPEPVSEALRQAVLQGAGLVLAHYAHDPVPPAWEAFLAEMAPADVQPIARGIGETLTPEWRGGLDFLHAGVAGEGRVVTLEYGGARPRHHFLVPQPLRPLEAEQEYLDAYYSLVARACLWAAKREPETWIAGIEEAGPTGPTDEEIPPIFPDEYVDLLKENAVRQPYLPYRIRLNRPADNAYAVRVQVRQPGRNRTDVYETYEKDLPLGKGQTVYPVSLGIGAGRHFLDVWLLDKGRVVDWYTAVLEVRGWPEISDLRFSKETLLPNDSLAVSLFVRPPLHEQLYLDRGAVVFARAVDPLQRVVSMATANLRQRSGPVQLTLDFADLLTHQVKVEVFVVDTPQVLVFENRELSEIELGRAAHAHRYFPVWQPLPANDFAVVVSGESYGEYGARKAYRQLADRGADLLCTSEGTAGGLHGTGAGLRPVPVLAQYPPGLSENGRRVPCLTDPRFLTRESDLLEKAIRRPGFEKAPLASLGDGNALALPHDDLCRSETCLDGFRIWLQAEYGSLDALNAAWGAAYTDWNEAAPATLDTLRGADRLGPWTDFRQYMDSVFASIHTFDRDIAAVHNREMRVGFAAEARPHALSGYDWHFLVSEGLVTAVPSAGTAVEKAFSYRRPQGFITVRYDGGRGSGTPAYARWLPWHAVLHRMGGVWFGDVLGTAEAVPATAALAPDQRVYPHFAGAMDEAILIKGGFDTVFLDATPLQADIAIYDSAASYYTGLARDTEAGAPDTRQAEEAWAVLLGDLGYTFAFITPAQAVEGGLQAYKGLVLPTTWALGDDEVQAIAAFQQEGRLLIADLVPGRYDRHGAVRPAPALAEAFGVAVSGPPGLGEPVEAAFPGWGKDGPAGLGAVTADTSVAAGDAVAKGSAAGAPLWLVRGREGARALLLNHGLAMAGLDAAAAPLGALLRESGLDPSLDIRPSKDGFHGRGAVFQYGKAAVYTLLRDPVRGRDEERLELRLPEGGKVYNMLEGGTARRGQRVPLRLAQGRPALITRLPYAVEGIDLEVEPETAPGRRLPVFVRIRTSGGIADRHVVRIEFGPVSGSVMAHYGQTLVCEEGKGSTYIPLELHENPGLYRVVAWDVLSGQSVQAMARIVQPRSEDRTE